MLKLKDMIEDFDLAKTILGNWAYDTDTIDQCLNYFRISSNAVYPFRQNGRLCFLRFAPVTEKRLSNLQGELEFIQYLRANGYLALEPIPAKDGAYVKTLETGWGTYYATAFYGVPGEPIEDTDFSESMCFEYGKALGKLHTLSTAFTPKVRKETHEDILQLIEERLVALSADSVAKEELSALRKALSAFPQDTAHYGLVHYDFECDNVFYDEETKTCHVIDFDDAVYHFYAVDVEQALDSIREEAQEDVQAAAQEAFLSGYRTAFPFDETAEEMLPVMRRFCNLYSYTKILYCLSESVPEEPDWMEELKEKLTKKAARLLEGMAAAGK